MAQPETQINVVQTELAAASAALQSGWRPVPIPVTAEQGGATTKMRGLIAKRRQFLKAQER